MRFQLLLCLTVACTWAFAADLPDLQKEDLRAIKSVLKKQDNSYDWIQALAKKAIPTDLSGAERSVMLVEAAPTELRPTVPRPQPVGPQMQLALFLVKGVNNEVLLTLDSFPLKDVIANATLDEPSEHSAYLHFYSDYGMYQGSFKYIYDLARRAPAVKIPYGILALTSSTRQQGRLRYTGVFGSAPQTTAGTERHAAVTIEPGAAPSLPKFTIADMSVQEEIYQAPRTLRTQAGESVMVANSTPPGQEHQPSGIYVAGKSGAKRFFKPPLPTVDFYRSNRPGRQLPGEIWSDIGPYAISGDTIWFASTFYDGEGISGLGAVGAFHIATRTYRMQYLPEITDWSGSAILLDGDDLWIGLMTRPEGATRGGGLLRYNTKTGSARKYAIADVINTIDRVGDALYSGTSHGLYVLRGESIIQLLFEPDAKGKLTMVSRAVH